jgi:hypothetical protein
MTRELAWTSTSPISVPRKRTKVIRPPRRPTAERPRQARRRLDLERLRAAPDVAQPQIATEPDLAIALGHEDVGVLLDAVEPVGRVGECPRLADGVRRQLGGRRVRAGRERDGGQQAARGVSCARRPPAFIAGFAGALESLGEVVREESMSKLGPPA